MYARVVSSSVRPGKMDEDIRIYRGIAASVEQKGFKGALYLTDPNTNKTISVTLWETKADMEASEASGWWQEQVNKFADVVADQPVREVYEVSVQV
jgi:heme-degrading monooxygenase HmoA